MNEGKQLEDIFKSMIVKEVEDYVDKYMVNYESDMDNFTDVITKLKANIAKRFNENRDATEGLIGSVKTLTSDMADYEDQREDMDTLISNQSITIAGLNVRTKRLEALHKIDSIPHTHEDTVTFKKGEVVMVCDRDERNWRVRIYSHSDCGFHTVDGCEWKQCRKLNATERGE